MESSQSGKPGPGRRRPRPSKPAPDPGTREPKTRRALVVEGDPTARMICRQTLEDLGYLVDMVDHGVAAVTAARQYRPQLVVIALQLPDATGLEVARWFKSDPELSSIPVIAMIALGLADAQRLAKEPAIDAIIRKPVSPTALKHAIRELGK